VILRRLYIYLVSAAALVVFAFALVSLGDAVLPSAIDRTDYLDRPALAGYTAAVVVSFPVWAIHMWFGGRFARRDAAERVSAIRRLYLYLACAGSSIGAALALANTVTYATQQQLDGQYLIQSMVAQGAWATVVLASIWAFHYRIAARDRAAVGEVGASATLRRWYMYIALIVGLFMMLGGAQQLIQVTWLRDLHSSLLSYGYPTLSPPAGELAAGSLLWALHARLLATRYAVDDRGSTLRAVEGFIAVAICIAVALVGASQILYYSVARVLGVESPGGISNDLVAEFAQPASTMVVFGIAWFLIRLRLTRDAGSGEAARQAGMRRFYTNLAALLSMAAFATGAAGFLGTVLVQAEAQFIGVSAPDWKDPLSLWVTLLVVGGAVWVAHWRQVPWLGERQALSRRLYLWVALVGSVLGVLGGGIGLLYVVFQQTFSLQPKLADPANLSFAQSLAVVVVAAAVGLYHWRILRSDAASRHAVPVPPSAAAPADTAPVDEPEHAAEPAPGVHYALSVVGATEDDVHQALANLPPQASYKLVPSDHPA
jgi:hypothetical protein